MGAPPSPGAANAAANGSCQKEPSATTRGIPKPSNWRDELVASHYFSAVCLLRQRSAAESKVVLAFTDFFVANRGSPGLSAVGAPRL